MASLAVQSLLFAWEDGERTNLHGQFACIADSFVAFEFGTVLTSIPLVLTACCYVMLCDALY